jgi:hypothetical protein
MSVTHIVVVVRTRVDWGMINNIVVATYDTVLYVQASTCHTVAVSAYRWEPETASIRMVF